VLYWAKKLITLWEGGLPYKLDAVSGSTIGRSQLGGVLKNENIPLGGRYKYDSNTHRMILYSNVLPTPTISPLDLWKQSGTGGIGASSSIITMYEFDESFRLVQQQQSPLTMDNFGLVTDFGITKDFYIIIEPPLRIKNKMSFAVNKDPGSSLVMQDEGMSVRCWDFLFFCIWEKYLLTLGIESFSTYI
jgi:carotenoid cleavage dioxygenase-like enzyme